jgi:hypothetical protein
MTKQQIEDYLLQRYGYGKSSDYYIVKKLKVYVRLGLNKLWLFSYATGAFEYKVDTLTLETLCEKLDKIEELVKRYVDGKNRNN